MIVDRPSSRTSEPRPSSEELVYLSGRVPARVARRATHQVYPRRPTRRRAAPRRDPSVPRRSQPQQIAGTAADYATSTTSGEEEQHRVHGRTCAQDVGKPVHASTCAPIWFSTSRPSAARNHSAGLIHGLSFRPEHWASGLAAPCGPSPPQPAALVPATCRKWPTGVSAGRADGPSAQRAPRTESGPRQRHGTGDGFGRLRVSSGHAADRLDLGAGRDWEVDDGDRNRKGLGRGWARCAGCAVQRPSQAAGTRISSDEPASRPGSCGGRRAPGSVAGRPAHQLSA
jgi:hypothetical protein